MGENILNSGVHSLNLIKEELYILEDYKIKSAEFDALENKLEKKVQNKEKAIHDEISDTVKKRKDEITSSFDEQLSITKNRLKKIQLKKDKMKGNRVSERIYDETTLLREDSYSTQLVIKSQFKQNKISPIFNHPLYYALYSPIGIKDILFIIGIFLLIYFVIPCGVYFFLIPEKKIMFLVTIYIITVLLSGSIFILINNLTKVKHKDTMAQIKELRIHLLKNRKQMNKMRRRIKKDRDESMYGLDEFDQEIKILEDKIKSLINEKTEALQLFEATAQQVVESEIWTKNEEELISIRQEYQHAHLESNTYEDKQKELSVKITNAYEAYIGKEFMRIDKIDALIEIFEKKGVSNISEAIRLYKQETA